MLNACRDALQYVSMYVSSVPRSGSAFPLAGSDAVPGFHTEYVNECVATSSCYVVNLSFRRMSFALKANHP